MKQLLIILFTLVSLIGANAQQYERLSYSATVGYGWDISTPSYNPFGVQILALYNFNSHFGVGCETGIIKYENLVIPIVSPGNIDSARLVRQFLS